MTRRSWYWLLFGLLFLGTALIAAYELIASPFQAMFLADYAKRLSFHDENGPSDRIRFPQQGPFDLRFGYSLLPEFTDRLKQEGFTVVRQARISHEMASLDKFGLFLPYREKAVAGLTLEDCAETPYFRFRQPRQAYSDFAAIPHLVANTLLFIENRELLDPNHPQRNPAVEWDRLAEALLEKMVQTVQPGHHVPGGSTLATQLEKYRHANDGLTMTPGDKLRQMASASVRAYLDGPDTRVTRRRIVLDYLNTVPLSAAPGFGEVDGLADGLNAWFGLDFKQVNQLLAHPEHTEAAARAYKHVLALLISQRKPSWYLITGRSQLNALADVHLGLLAQAGIISPAFRDLARKQHISFSEYHPSASEIPFTQRKAATAARNDLANLLGIDRLYDLDRLDLTVTTSLHSASQEGVTAFLASLKDKTAAQAAGLYAHGLLSPEDDLSKIIYSFTLYERTAAGSAMRVQADSLNQPFDINQGAKLGMGSSAKLRTLVTYLEIIAELHDQYGKLDAKALSQVQVPAKDALTRWAVDYLIANPNRDLGVMLHAAMDRHYSANPGEGFYTGGGLHHFVNFAHWEDSQVMTVWDALQNSVNLSFVRLMRDIVNHFMYGSDSATAMILDNADDPRRHAYLLQFADKEGQSYLLQFYKKYRGLNPGQVTELFFSRLTPFPRRLSAVYRYLEPNADLATFTRLMKTRLSDPETFDDKDFEQLYAAYAIDKFNLADRAYIAQTHPLELWLVAYLRQHPDAHWDELVKASAQARVDSYDWLFKTSHKNAQDIRIRSLLETEAFQKIHLRWQRLGYPFSSLVPSYATAIGSSADRPAALADLMGIVLNDGVKQTSATYKRLDFATGTPFHTVFAPNDSVPRQLIPREVAQVVREALVNVVTGGTAKRVDGAFVTQRGKLVIGGKTGTGDNRFDTFARNGAVLHSRVVNRVATFVFYIGRHFYGVITAYVPGQDAGNYGFTSALPVQVLKAMAPTLQPLVAAGEGRSLGWQETLADFEAEPMTGSSQAPAQAAPGAVVQQPATPVDTESEAAEPDTADDTPNKPLPLKRANKLSPVPTPGHPLLPPVLPRQKPSHAPAAKAVPGPSVAPVLPQGPAANTAPAGKAMSAPEITPDNGNPPPPKPAQGREKPPADKFDPENYAPGEGFHLID